MNIKKIGFFILAGIIIFSGGFILGNSDYFKKIINPFKPSEQRLGDGVFTNPLLDCEIADGSINVEFANFKPVIEKYLKANIDGKNLSYAAVYFRNLNNGLWFGVNEKDNFTPASLLKLPLMISYFKAAESNLAILNKKLRLDKKFDISNLKQIAPPSSEIEVGKDYSVAELIKRSIIKSDNQATALLSLNINDQNIEEDIFRKLGFSEEDVKNFWFNISVKQYSSLFRILFNASYLSQEYSERALNLLSKSEFQGGLMAGVPKDIIVAHKFGERGDLNNELMQFHDCGIIYYPKQPYILCVMTRGGNDDKLISTIREISGITYKEVDKQVKRFLK